MGFWSYSLKYAQFNSCLMPCWICHHFFRVDNCCFSVHQTLSKKGSITITRAKYLLCWQKIFQIRVDTNWLRLLTKFCPLTHFLHKHSWIPFHKVYAFLLRQNDKQQHQATYLITRQFTILSLWRGWVPGNQDFCRIQCLMSDVHGRSCGGYN